MIPIEIYLDWASSVQVGKEVFFFKFGEQVRVWKLENITDGMIKRDEETLDKSIRRFTVTAYHADQNPTIFLVGGENCSWIKLGEMYAFS